MRISDWNSDVCSSDLARTQRRDSHEMMAEIFNNLDRNTENRFISMLEERNRDSADRIKQLMFTFDDLAKVDPAGVQTLLRAVDKDKLATALKGASEALRELFRSEEHTSELQSLMRISYAVFCLKKKKNTTTQY